MAIDSAAAGGYAGWVQSLKISRVIVLGALLCCAASARADCPDEPVSCALGALGTQGTCWDLKRLSCRACGPRRCPTPPTAVPTTYTYACVATVRADKVQYDGCSNPLTDGLSTLYKQLFRPACEQHDLCYHNPLGITKATCDNDFRRNMTWLCRDYYKGTRNQAQLSLCLTAVGTWYSTVSTVPLSRTLWDSDHAWTAAHCPKK